MIASGLEAIEVHPVIISVTINEYEFGDNPEIMVLTPDPE